jgi:hypothetical protein
MLDHISTKLQPIPPAKGNSVMQLADVIGAAGAAQVETSGALRFHAVGDTGRRSDSPQGVVADEMASDYKAASPASSPGFLFHLGDVIYGHDKKQQFRPEFYEPYAHYPGKILAIPGNHDGEVFPGSDPRTLAEFLANFCAKSAVIPPIAGTIYRETMTQPGVYWILKTKFVDIVGLYSNVAENPGYISGGKAGLRQSQWLTKTLKEIAKERGKGIRKGLVFATHHPPFSSAGHSGSKEMLADIDQISVAADVLPDLFLSGHAHNYQRYTRRMTLQGRALEIPYLVAGTGGIGEQPVPEATGAVTGDHTYVRSRKGYGYLLVTATAGTIAAKFIAVDPEKRTKLAFDQVTVTLATGKVA